MIISPSTQIDTFIEDLSGKSAVPGGGGASALAAALGVALGNMVGSLTVGKKKYEEYEEEIIALNKESRELSASFLAMINEDAESFLPLSKAYSLPKNTDEEKKIRNEILEIELNNACSIPLKIMKSCCQAIEICSRYYEIGSKLCISDAGCGVALCISALKGGALNVFVNTKLMKNRETAAKLNEQVQEMLNKYVPIGESIYNKVVNELHE